MGICVLTTIAAALFAMTAAAQNGGWRPARDFSAQAVTVSLRCKLGL